MRMIKKLLGNEKGATAIEYGLIAALVAIAAIGGMTAVGTSMQNRFTYVSNRMGSN
jgi:pilus assembly protein Flp/PilA